MEVDKHVKRHRVVQLEAQEGDEEKDPRELRGQRDRRHHTRLRKLQQVMREKASEETGGTHARHTGRDGIQLLVTGRFLLDMSRRKEDMGSDTIVAY